MDPQMIAAMMQMGGQGGGGFGAAIPGFLQGIFGNSGRPYQKAGNAYKGYYGEAQGFQNPFYDRGVEAGGNFNAWLSGMKNPSDFINALMNNYQQSPWARYQQQEANRAATNFASANGLAGSSPMAQQMQQNAANISSQDIQNWLQNVLGINSQYGQGLYGQMGMGQHAADVKSGLAQNAGEYMGGVAYGREAGRQSDRNSFLGGVGKLFGG